MALGTKIREVGNVVILDLSGRITIGETCSQFRDEIRGMLDSGYRNIIVNLAEVSYIDSCGLGQIVGCFATVAHRGGKLKLLNLRERVTELMYVTKLHTIFESFNNEAEAVRSFGAAAHG